MNRWEALVAVVRAFRPHERPFIALCALLIVVGIPAAAAVILAGYAENVGQTVLGSKTQVAKR